MIAPEVVTVEPDYSSYSSLNSFIHLNFRCITPKSTILFKDDFVLQFLFTKTILLCQLLVNNGIRFGIVKSGCVGGRSFNSS